jgi:hypothetical protein
VLDRLYVDQTTQKIQPPPIPPRRQKSRGKIQNGFYLPALQAVTAAKGFIAGQFPTLAVAALCCSSYRGSLAAAVAILKTEDPDLLTSVLAGRKPLLKTAKSIRNAIGLVDSFRRASSFELQIFGRVISPEKIFDEVVVPAS